MRKEEALGTESMFLIEQWCLLFRECGETFLEGCLVHFRYWSRAVKKLFSWPVPCGAVQQLLQKHVMVANAAHHSSERGYREHLPVKSSCCPQPQPTQEGWGILTASCPAQQHPTMFRFVTPSCGKANDGT